MIPIFGSAREENEIWKSFIPISSYFPILTPHQVDNRKKIKIFILLIFINLIAPQD